MLGVYFLFGSIVKIFPLGDRSMSLINTILSGLQDICEALIKWLTTKRALWYFNAENLTRNIYSGQLIPHLKIFQNQLRQANWPFNSITILIVFSLKFIVCKYFLKQKYCETNLWAVGTFRALPWDQFMGSRNYMGFTLIWAILFFIHLKF